jgi:hypothetical protein
MPAGPIDHGFITTRKAANGPVESRDLVLACGDNKTSKPKANLV